SFVQDRWTSLSRTDGHRCPGQMDIVVQDRWTSLSRTDGHHLSKIDGLPSSSRDGIQKKSPPRYMEGGRESVVGPRSPVPRPWSPVPRFHIGPISDYSSSSASSSSRAYGFHVPCATAGTKSSTSSGFHASVRSSSALL